MLNKLLEHYPYRANQMTMYPHNSRKPTVTLSFLRAFFRFVFVDCLVYLFNILYLYCLPAFYGHAHTSIEGAWAAVN